MIILENLYKEHKVLYLKMMVILENLEKLVMKK